MPYLAPASFVDVFRGQRPPRSWRGPAADGTEWDTSARLEPPTLTEWANLYDANLRWADSLVGDVVNTLRDAGVLEHTLLIVTADHGEAMREHGYALHQRCPYDETLHIPLLMRFPGKAPPVGRVHALTQTIDLVPTLLDLTGVPYPRDTLQGVSLVSLLAGESSAASRVMVSLTTGGGTRTYTVRDADSTLMLTAGAKVWGLYDMDADPWQTRSLRGQEGARTGPLLKAFRSFAQTQRYLPPDFLDPSAKPHAPSAAGLSEEEKRTLRSLGYVQ
jgi:arylsulfatase A-like enzyme